MKNQNSANTKISTILGKGTVIEGDFYTSGSSRVDGIINGNVTIKGTLILGACGRINGDIQSEAALIGGEVIGNVIAIEKLEATDTAKIIGNITTKVLVIDEHAIFQGGCDMNQDVSNLKKTAPRPGSKAVRSNRKSAKAAIEEALKEVEEENGTKEVEKTVSNVNGHKEAGELKAAETQIL